VADGEIRLVGWSTAPMLRSTVVAGTGADSTEPDKLTAMILPLYDLQHTGLPIKENQRAPDGHFRQL